jgi:TRAP-type C4-dicarboxylate transport system substrate-binding protein
MRRVLIGAAAAVFAMTGAPLAGALAAGEVVDGPRVHWNYSLWGKSRAVTTAVENLGPWLEKKTGGKFTVQIHWGTLSPPKSVPDGLKLGAFEAGSYCAAYYPAKFPAFTGLDLPFLPIANLDQLRAVTDAYQTDPVLVEEAKKWNAMYHQSSLLPLYEVVGKGTPPASLDDWKGMRIRALGAQGTAMQKLGAVPTSVPAPEVYVSLDRGLIDAAAFAYYAHDSYRTWELGKWFTTGLAFGSIHCGSIFNIDAFNRLPKQYQALLHEFNDAPEGYPALINALNTAENAMPAKFIERGLTEVKVNPERRAEFVKVGGEPVWKEWADKMGESGYDGDRLLKLILDLAEKNKGLGG